MKAMIDTDTEAFFNYLDKRSDLKLEFSNKVIEKIAEYIVKGNYECLMDAFVKRINKELEGSDIKYEVNPANPHKLTVNVNTAKFGHAFRTDILDIAREFTSNVIKHELKNEITNKIREVLISSFDDKIIESFIKEEIKKQITTRINHLLIGE